MPKRDPESLSVPLAVSEITARWGKLLKTHRIRRNITIADMKTRLGISLSTLQRMERGELTVQTCTYLHAMTILGLLDTLCPLPADTGEDDRQRARPARRGDDYF